MNGKKKIPMRKCVGCGEMKAKKELLRVLRTEDDEFVLIRPAEKTDGVLMSVFQVSVLQRRQKIKGWNVRLSRQFQKKYMNGWKRRWNNLKQDRVLSLIGLATKAGKCASGEFMTENETKSGKAALVIVAEDASDNTKKKFRDMCKFYEVPIYFYGDKDTLGHAMGKEFRASLAILDEGFAKGIRKQLEIKNNTIA